MDLRHYRTHVSRNKRRSNKDGDRPALNSEGINCKKNVWLDDKDPWLVRGLITVPYKDECKGQLMHSLPGTHPLPLVTSELPNSPKLPPKNKYK